MPEAPPPPSERVEGLRDLAGAVRELIERVAGTSAPLDAVDGMAADIRAMAARFEGYAQAPLYGFGEAANAGGSEGPFDNSPLLGKANPIAPPLLLTVEADKVVGTATFGSAYEGPPGCVHGGFVAAAFDELLGLTQGLGGQPGMTGRLTVHYRSPTPLHTELRFHGWIDRIEGRKTFCVGTIHAGDRLCAESEGLFVALREGSFEALAADAAARRAG